MPTRSWVPTRGLPRRSTYCSVRRAGGGSPSRTRTTRTWLNCAASPSSPVSSPGPHRFRAWEPKSSSGVHRLAEGKHGYIFVGSGVAVLGFLFVVSVLGTFALMGVPDQRRDFFGNGQRGMFGMKMAAPPVAMAQADFGPGGGGAPGL